MQGTHFRRQVPIGSYVVDFACMTARLIIELDGSHHADDPQRSRDAARTRWLETEGYRVIRFWNNDLTDNPDGVLDAIRAALYGSREAEPTVLKHSHRQNAHPTPPSAPTLPLQGRVKRASIAATP